MILSRALTQSRSLSLFLTLSLSLSECSGTHTHSLVSPVHSYTRGIWRGGIDEHEYQEHSPRPSRPAVILRRLRLEHSCTHIVMLLACHASIERQKQTGSGMGGCIVRPWIRFPVQTPMRFAVSETCETTVPHRLVAHYCEWKLLQCCRRWRFRPLLANIFTAIWNITRRALSLRVITSFEIINIHFRLISDCCDKFILLNIYPRLRCMVYVCV